MLFHSIKDKLAHLVGDYQSDSDNDDSDRKKAIKHITTGKFFFLQ